MNWLTVWRRKFRVAFVGLIWAVGDQNSFRIHLSVTFAVIVLAGILQVELWQWGLLCLSIGGVLTAELLNTSIEQLTQRLHPEQDAQIGRALDVAAAAVLVMSLTAVVVGLLVFLPAISQMVQ